MKVTLSGGPGVVGGGGASPPPPLVQGASRAATRSGRRAARSRRALGRSNLGLLSDGERRLMPEEDAPFGHGEDDVQRHAGEGEDADGGEQRRRVEVGVSHEDEQTPRA